MTDRHEQQSGNSEEAAVDWRARGTVSRLVLGQMATQALGTAVRSGVFDRIGAGELSADALAGSLGTHPQATLRLLRALAGLQLLSETEPGVFRTTAAGDFLRADTAGSMAAMARMFTDPVMLRGWDLLDESIRTGETTFETVFGTDFFGHLKEHPELSAAFNEAMSQGTRLTAANVPHHFDFGRFDTLVDIGGGDGTLLASVLRKHHRLRGVLFDTAEGLAQAPHRLAQAGLTGRVALETGDFFASAPAGGDVYLLKSIMHDWDDARCAAVLRRIRDVIPAHGSLLIVEPVLTATVPPDLPGGVYLSDLNMLVNVGGRERTADDFAALCTAGGFTLRGVTPLPAPDVFQILEASPA
ncbi:MULTISPECIES: methyltransferase [unclassified Streptomyces]|uniref:methyltransferase n=1 Tax=unclassified Streptomyces TaxID=2593676 RepID=UPI0037BB92E2